MRTILILGVASVMAERENYRARDVLVHEYCK